MRRLLRLILFTFLEQKVKDLWKKAVNKYTYRRSCSKTKRSGSAADMVEEEENGQPNQEEEEYFIVKGIDLRFLAKNSTEGKRKTVTMGGNECAPKRRRIQDEDDNVPPDQDMISNAEDAFQNIPGPSSSGSRVRQAEYSFDNQSGRAKKNKQQEDPLAQAAHGLINVLSKKIQSEPEEKGLKEIINDTIEQAFQKNEEKFNVNLKYSDVWKLIERRLKNIR